VANAYLDPARSRPNLTVITGAHVDRVLLENARAAGVAYRQNGVDVQVAATREVIVSAGTIHSPAILMRSGIGPAAQLREHGIDVMLDLPGVGQNLREHNTISVAQLVSIPTLSAQLGPLRMVGHLFNYLFRRKGLLTTPAVQVMAALKSEPDLADPDLILSMLPVAVNFDNKGNAVVEKRPSFSFGFHVARPQSRGEIRLRSANPDDKPIIDHRLLGDSGDVTKLVKGLKIVERLCRAPALANIITGPLKPDPFPDNDADLESYVRASGGIGYHSVGTCRMGPDGDPLAVLDPDLNVRGVAGLRVVDASAMPEPVSANTNAPTIMIAERAAEFIRSKP
jgi:choline dehydrogenase